MKTCHPLARKLALVLVAAISLLALPAMANTISNTFSLGYGFTSAQTWNTNETAAANAWPSAPFTLSVSVAGTWWGSTGPFFSNRVLRADANFSAWMGRASDFTVTVTSAYTSNYFGAASNITLDISSIRIYGATHSGFTTNNLGWHEATVGHTGNSAYIYTPYASGGGYNDTSAWKQLTWNPGAYTVSSNAISRVFTLNFTTNNAPNRALDGFEVLGTISVVAIPEPGAASALLLSVGGLVLLRRRPWRG